MTNQHEHPTHKSFPSHGSHAVTVLVIAGDRIISASDDSSILVYTLHSGELISTLEGHQGGIWSLSVNKDTLVSGSTDRTIRIWDLLTGKCKHVFSGHTSTVRALAIATPEWVEVTGANGVVQNELWPKSAKIVSGSRDHTLRVWALPEAGGVEFKANISDKADLKVSL